jgi:hypothetical protein
VLAQAQPHWISAAPGVQNVEVTPQTQSQLGVPLQAAGMGKQLGFMTGGGPASRKRVPLHAARQYSSAPHV